MEFLLIWVLGGDVIDSGLRYKNAAKCFSEAQNAAAEMLEVGLKSPQFTCIQLEKVKNFKFTEKTVLIHDFHFKIRTFIISCNFFL